MTLPELLELRSDLLEAYTSKFVPEWGKKLIGRSMDSTTDLINIRIHLEREKEAHNG